MPKDWLVEITIDGMVRVAHSIFNRRISKTMLDVSCLFKTDGTAEVIVNLYI